MCMDTITLIHLTYIKSRSEHTLSGAVLGKALGGSSHAHKCRDHAPYFAHARSAVTKTPRAFAMRMLIDIVGVVVIERARVIGARLFSAMCFGAT